jgi:hypothetical protein
LERGCGAGAAGEWEDSSRKCTKDGVSCTRAGSGSRGRTLVKGSTMLAIIAATNTTCWYAAGPRLIRTRASVATAAINEICQSEFSRNVSK